MIFRFSVIVVLTMLFLTAKLNGQSFWFGPKVGLGLNWQSWGNGLGNGLNRDQLISIPADIYIESYDEEDKGALYAQLGFRTKGSSFRFVSFLGDFDAFQGFKFRNVLLEVGARKRLEQKVWNMIPFYSLGIRGEYNINTNLDSYEAFGSLFYPEDEFVRKFLYGVSAGGGFEFDYSEFSRMFFEFTINPDISFQYEQPPLLNVIDPFTRQPTNLPLRQVRNLSMEFKIGIKFLRKVVYID